ncbi:diguanylate cyclase [Bordetella genomosp. 13]|uniref:diguanylate cyclase n=1 Tax=Bordetella genomosp. 13 TaxID=463040 RepID=UPI0011A87F3B|nr:diguanylate cyclase [Bordetella genomosp. 13]
MEDIAVGILLYFIVPLWLLAGVADWFCHRATDIARTAGPAESVLHLLQFTEIGVALLACLLLEINALVFAVMLTCFVLHEATALLDVWYAGKRRYIGAFEQHVHSFLELLPLTAGILVALLHWEAFLSLFGLSDMPADWRIMAKRDPVPLAYVIALLAAATLLEGLPYLEELWRGLRARRTGGRRTTGRAELAGKVD